jgi:hypothetical protein
MVMEWHWFYTVLATTAVCASLGFGYEAIFGDHDPGSVFPWMFMALVYAVGGGIAGLFGSIAFEIAHWLFFRV